MIGDEKSPIQTQSPLGWMIMSSPPPGRAPIGTWFVLPPPPDVAAWMPPAPTSLVNTTSPTGTSLMPAPFENCMPNVPPPNTGSVTAE